MQQTHLWADNHQDSIAIRQHLLENITILQNEDYEAWLGNGYIEKLVDIFIKTDKEKNISSEIDLTLAIYYLKQQEKSQRLEQFIQLYSRQANDTSFQYITWKHKILTTFWYKKIEQSISEESEEILYNYSGELQIKDTLSNQIHYIDFINCHEINKEIFGLDLNPLKDKSNKNSTSIKEYEGKADNQTYSDTFSAVINGDLQLFVFEKIEEQDSTYYILNIPSEELHIFSYNLLYGYNDFCTIILEEDHGFITIQFSDSDNKATWFDNDGNIKHHFDLVKL